MYFKPRSLKSLLLVTVQMVCITFIAIRGKVIPENIVQIIFTAPFIFIGIWAVFTMRFRFNIAPDIPDNADFISSGPYRFIRHPMYASVLGLTLIWTLSVQDTITFLVWAILSADIIMKINHEENILRKKFNDFDKHIKTTKRIIPYIY